MILQQLEVLALQGTSFGTELPLAAHARDRRVAFVRKHATHAQPGKDTSNADDGPLDIAISLSSEAQGRRAPVLHTCLSAHFAFLGSGSP